METRSTKRLQEEWRYMIGQLRQATGQSSLLGSLKSMSLFLPLHPFLFSSLPPFLYLRVSILSIRYSPLSIFYQQKVNTSGCPQSLLPCSSHISQSVTYPLSLFSFFFIVSRFQKVVDLEKIPDMIFGRSHLTFKNLSHPFEFVINPLDAIKGILKHNYLTYLLY